MIPKFRAWFITNKVMIPPMALTQAIHQKENQFSLARLEDEFIFMQSTGLFDKNGVEIYEGDIVKVTDDYGDTNFSDGGIGTICGLDDLYMWYIDGQVHNGLYDIDQCYYIEVIGNIYKTPELLGDKYD